MCPCFCSQSISYLNVHHFKEWQVIEIHGNQFFHNYIKQLNEVDVNQKENKKKEGSHKSQKSLSIWKDGKKAGDVLGERWRWPFGSAVSFV